jgi:hypothetical protein
MATDPCAGASVGQLFIPRKNSLQNPSISRTKEFEDQLANWLAIQNWANSLSIAGSTAAVGLIASNQNIAFPNIPDSTNVVVPYDLEIFANGPCAFSNDYTVGGTTFASMCSFKLPGVVHCDCGVSFEPAQAMTTTGYVTVSIHELSLPSGGGGYDNVIAQQTCLIPTDASIPIALSASIDGYQAAGDSSFYATVFQKSGTTMQFKTESFSIGTNCNYLTAHMVNANQELLNAYPTNS